MAIQGAVLDLEGTLVQNGEALPGAADFVHHLNRQGIPCRIVTNIVSRTPGELSAILQSSGIPILPSQIITPVHVLDQFLTERRNPQFWFVGPDSIRERLSARPGSGETAPEYVVLGDFEQVFPGYEEFNRIFRFLQNGARLITLSSSPYYTSQEGPRLDTGAFCRLFECASGQQAIVMGKPSVRIYQTALRQLGLRPSQAIAIGDDVQTDIQGAKKAGLKTLLLRTGKYRSGDERFAAPDSLAEDLFDAVYAV
jgi:HAD superfamily hydrolase (TIGR01458 family)